MSSSAKDLQILDDELQLLTDQIRDILRTLDTASADTRAAKVSKGQDLIKRAQRTLHHFKVELRQSKDGDVQHYEKRWNELNATLTNYKEQLQGKRGVAGGAAAAGASSMPEPSGDPVRDEAHAIGRRIEDTQNAAIAALKRAERTVEETKQVGEEATETMSKQTEQMKRINTKLDKMESDVDRAKTEVRAFMRRMMTDKIIICFALLILIAIIAVVVLRIQAPELLGGGSPAAPPASTTTTTFAPIVPPPTLPPTTTLPAPTPTPAPTS